MAFKIDPGAKLTVMPEGSSRETVAISVTADTIVVSEPLAFDQQARICFNESLGYGYYNYRYKESEDGDEQLSKVLLIADGVGMLRGDFNAE